MIIEFDIFNNSSIIRQMKYFNYKIHLKVHDKGIQFCYSNCYGNLIRHKALWKDIDFSLCNILLSVINFPVSIAGKKKFAERLIIINDGLSLINLWKEFKGNPHKVHDIIGELRNFAFQDKFVVRFRGVGTTLYLKWILLVIWTYPLVPAAQSSIDLTGIDATTRWNFLINSANAPGTPGTSRDREESLEWRTGERGWREGLRISHTRGERGCAIVHYTRWMDTYTLRYRLCTLLFTTSA